MDLKTLYFLAKCSNEYYDFAVRISQHYGLPITADNSKFLDCLELVGTSTQKEQSIIANVSNSLCDKCEYEVLYPGRFKCKKCGYEYSL